MAEYAFGAGEMVNRLLTLVVGEIGLVVGVKEEVKKLETVLRGIQAVLQDAQKKQGEREVVRHWLHQLMEVAYDAEDVLDDVDYKELKFTISKKKLPRWFNPKRGNARRKIAHKIKAIKKRLAEIYDNMKMLQLVPLESNPQSGSAGYAVVDDRETYSYIKDSIVFGREDDKKEIIQKLIKDDGSSSSSSSSTDGHQENPSSGVGNTLPVISIVGLGGLGKTTLASLVYNDHAVTKHFELRVWICVSTHFRTANLFYQLLQQINRGNALPESSSKQILLDDLKTQLERQGKKKLLLVLDDDWNEDLAKWEDFVLPWGRFVSTGSKIIVTSRNRKVASVTRSQLRIELKGLSNESCWDLLRRHAFPPEGPRKITPNLVEIGKKISSKCKGVPLAAKVIGSLLQSKKEEWEWLAVQNDEIWSLDEDNQIMKVLKFSYDDLSLVLQACFSYCAIFPKDFWIKKEELIHLWMAQGLLGASSSQCETTLELYQKKKKTLEDVGMKCFDTLYSKSFFQDARWDEDGVVASCKMHHFLHDLAQSIRGSECQVLGESSVRSTDLSRCRHVSMISLSTIEALQHEAKKVRTIFGWESTSKELDDGGTLEVPKRSTPFQFESLRVLDLRGLRGSDFSSISYKYLKHLRYLDLSSTSIKSLPKWVTRLYHLQTLKLIKCGKLTELPEDLIKLKKLRHLFIDDHKKWKKMAQALGELHQLQTLPLFVACQEDGGCGISVLKNLNDLRGELEIHRLSLVKKANLAKEGILSKKSSLRKLRLHWNRPSSVGGGGDELLVLEVLRPHTNLQRLSIEGFGGVKFPAWVSSGSDLPNLVRLKLSNCNHCEHIPSFGGLHQLKELELRSMANLKEWLEGGGVMFPCLEKLLIKDCPNLNKTPEHVFPSLKSLELENVGGMGVVSITSSSLTSLTSLTITNCEDLEYLQEGLVSNNSQLNVVVISNCPKLKAFREEGSASASAADEILPNRFLCELVIDNSSFSYAREGFFKILKCPELESIGKGFLSSLVFLERFRVDGDGCKLKRIELSQSFKHLRELQIMYCPNFEGFAHHSLRRSEQEEEEVLPCCHTLKISDCHAISSIDLRRFSSLRELKILMCKGLKSIIPYVRGFTSLQKLEIKRCPELEEAIPKRFWSSLLSVESLEVTDCAKLKFMIELSQHSFNHLQHLEINKCPYFDGFDISTTTEQQQQQQQQQLVLPCCHTLKISYCPAISSIDFQSFASLRELRITNCRGLQALQGLPFLTALQKLTIYGCPAISSIDFPTLPSLRELWIINCGGLQALQGLPFLTALQNLEIDECPAISSIDFQSFASLHELRISNCEGIQALQGLPFLTALQKLEIDECPAISSIDFQSFASLRELRIFNCEGLQALQGLPFLTALQELEINECPAISSIDFPTLPSLRELQITNCGGLQALQGLPFLTALQELEIHECPAISSIDFQSFASLRELWIANCGGLQALQGLPFLTALQEPEIHECPAISSIDFQSFASLRELRISNCRGLQALQGLPFNELQHLITLNSLTIPSFNCLTVVPEWLGNFASLQKLSFINCKNLRKLPSKELMLRLTSLKELMIQRCPAISSIDLPTLPSLHKLYIYHCPEISSIDLSTLPSLRELGVTYCEGLQALQGLQFLTALQELLLGSFSEELNDFPLTISANDDDASSLQSNNPLILPCLRKLQIHGWAALQSLPHHLQRFTTLKRFQIFNFSKLTELPEWLGNLTSLEELLIWECKNLSHLPSKEQMQRLTLLQKLDIHHCPGLKESCSRDGEEWPKISHIAHILIDRTSILSNILLENNMRKRASDLGRKRCWR